MDEDSTRAEQGSSDDTRPSSNGESRPTFLGDYRIVGKLGEGGMGIVYEAEQRRPKRRVAVKVVRGGSFVDENRIRMFQREAQSLARLKHPSIASIYGMGRTESGDHFFAMELVRGETLDDWAKRSDGSLRERLGVFCKVCDGVSYAHQRGVIHRDLKPANILVTKAAASASQVSGLGVPDVKILDFGLARITDNDLTMSTVLSEVGTIRGTLPYMSPEQVRGNPDEIDVRTDVYALGVILYRLIARRFPYPIERAPLPEAVRIICDEPPRPITESRDGSSRIDLDLSTIVMTALEKEPERRYPSASALAEDVHRYLNKLPILARPPSAAYQISKFVARHKIGVGFVVSLFVLLAAFAVTMAVQAHRIANERDRASREAETATHISGFLEGLFQVANPNESLGNTITVREILDEGAKKIGDELRNEPTIQGRLMDVMGRVYRGIGLYDQAEKLFREAVEVRSVAFGADSLEVAETLDGLARVMIDHGRIEEAKQVAVRSLAIKEKRLDPLDPELARSLYSAGAALIYSSPSGSAEGAGLVERALSIFEQSLGPESIEIAWCKNELAAERLRKDDLKGAQDYSLQALALKEELLPADHPDLAMGLNSVAWAMILDQEYEAALPLLERARDILEGTVGGEHSHSGIILHSLGELWWRSGDPVRALPYLEAALSAREGTLATDSPELFLEHMSLGGALRDLGRTEEARYHLERALYLREREASVASSFIEPSDVAREYVRLLRLSDREAEADAVEQRYGL